MGVSSCCLPPWWSAGLWLLPASEDFDDAHWPAAFGAWFSECERNDLGGWRVILFGRFCPEKCADFGDIAFAARAGEQTVVADAVETEGTRWLDTYVRGGFEVEHIFPQNPCEDAEAEFGEYEDDDIAQRLGNLVLVEKSINASLGNRPYSKKRPIYLQSNLLLTRALAEKPKVGENTKIDRAVASIEPYPTWNKGG